MASKSQLNLLCQKCRIAVPRYEPAKNEAGFLCSVTAGEQIFHSPARQPTKKAAENDAAGVALEAALGGNPAGASDFDKLLQWLDDAENRKKWTPFQQSINDSERQTPQVAVLPSLAGDSHPVAMNASNRHTSVNSGLTISHEDTIVVQPTPLLPVSSPPQVVPGIDCYRTLEQFCRDYDLLQPQCHVIEHEARYTAKICVGNRVYCTDWKLDTFMEAKQSAAAYALAVMSTQQLGIAPPPKADVQSPPPPPPPPITLQSALKAPSFFTKPQGVPAGAFTVASLPQQPIRILARGNTPPQPSLSTSPLLSSHPSPSSSSSSSSTLPPSPLTGQGGMELYQYHSVVPDTAAKLRSNMEKLTIAAAPVVSSHPNTHQITAPGVSSQLNAPQSQVSALQSSNADPPVSATVSATQANYKSILNEYCSKRHMPFPQYSAEDPSDTVGFIGVVTVDGKSYKSSVAKGNKKAAETEAAAEAVRALGVLSPNSIAGSRSNPPPPSPPPPSFGATNTVAMVSYKNLLQEHTQKLKVVYPDYSTERTEEGYQSIVTIHQHARPALRFTSSLQPTKKAAEQEVAKIACVEIGLLPSHATLS